MENDRIIRKYYPSLKDEKEIGILACVAGTMTHFGWSVADAPEVQARMTDKPILEEPYGYKLVDAASPDNLPSLEEYKQILSRLINRKILQQKIIPTKYGSPPREWIKNDEYLLFTNNDMTN